MTYTVTVLGREPHTFQALTSAVAYTAWQIGEPPSITADRLESIGFGNCGAIEFPSRIWKRPVRLEVAS